MAFGIFAAVFNERPARVRMSQDAYAEVCRRMGVLASPRVWGLRIELGCADGWRLENLAGDRYVSNTGDIGGCKG